MRDEVEFFPEDKQNMVRDMFTRNSNDVGNIKDFKMKQSSN